MALTSLEQTTNAITGASRVLIAPTADLNGDALSGAFGLGKALENMGKECCILLTEEIPQRFLFLPKPKDVAREITFDREFVLTIDTNALPIKDLRYEQEEGALKLFLTAPGHFTRDHIAFSPGSHKHDLVITVGAVDMESLGPSFEKYSQMFFEVPVLNIDHHSANERFGDINLVDVTASTVSEIIHEFLEAWDAEKVTEDIATCLLAGLLDGTRSFQDVSVTPKTLTAAARLVGRGAKQSDIIRYLYKSRSMNQLKMWGKILSRLELDDAHHVAHATLSTEDFVESTFNPKELPQLLDDFHMHFSHFATIALFFLHQNGDTEQLLRGLVSSREEHLLERLSHKYLAKRRGMLVSFRMEAPTISGAAPEFMEACYG